MNKQEQATQGLVFFQLTKIDEAKRLVFGRAVQEVPDRVGEVFDYETSVPNFKAWSASQFEASLGKSNGNIRAMHKDISAGVIVPGGLKFHDDEKAIDLTAHIGNDAEWAGVMDGRYTGFSIGGRYAKKWEGEDKRTHYTADPSEISLVDRPCIPTATFFEIQKADGSVMQKNFAPAEAEIIKVEPVVELEKKFSFPADAKKGDKAKDKAGDEHTNTGDGSCDCTKCAGKSNGVTDLTKDAALSADASTVVAGGDPVVDEYDIQATPEQVEEFCKLLAVSETPFAKVLDDLKKIATRKDTDPKEGKAAYGNVKFADAKNKKYPIDSEEHIRAAWNYINKGKNAGKYSADDVSVIKGHIVSAWKEKIDKDGPPAATKIDGGEMGKIEPKELRKNLSQCSEFAQLLSALCCLQERVEWEEEMENDDTELPARMMNCITDLGAILSEMVVEEVAEQAEGKEAAEPGAPVGEMPMTMSQAIVGLKKRAEELKPLIKYGARNSSKDQEALQKAHDALNMVGAKCNKSFVFGDSEPGAVTADAGTVNVGANTLKAEPSEDLKKMAAERDDLKKALETMASDIALLKAQPARSSIRLRAVGKGEDLNQTEEHTEVAPVKDAHGEVRKVATSIKELHKSGGEQLFKF